MIGLGMATCHWCSIVGFHQLSIGPYLIRSDSTLKLMHLDIRKSVYSFIPWILIFCLYLCFLYSFIQSLRFDFRSLSSKIEYIIYIKIKNENYFCFEFIFFENLDINRQLNASFIFIYCWNHKHDKIIKRKVPNCPL